MRGIHDEPVEFGKAQGTFTVSAALLLDCGSGFDGKHTIINEIHQAGRGAHGDACPGVLEKLCLLFDLEVLCKLKQGIRFLHPVGAVLGILPVSRPGCLYSGICAVLYAAVSMSFL